MASELAFFLHLTTFFRINTKISEYLSSIFKRAQFYYHFDFTFANVLFSPKMYQNLHSHESFGVFHAPLIGFYMVPNDLHLAGTDRD